MADMSKFSPDNGLTILNIKDAAARSGKVDKSDFVYCEDGDTALYSYLAHDFFYRNGVWCQTSKDVEVGDTWIPDGEENSNYYESNIKIQNYLNLKLDMSGVATPQYTDIASKNFRIGDIISISHSLGQNYAPIMWKVVNPIRKNSLLNPSRNITPVTIQDLLEALAEAQSVLIKDTVGWIGKNFNKGEQGFTFIKSSAPSNTFAYAKPIISGNKYIISMNISNVSGYSDGYALRVGLTSDDYEWSIPISSTGRIYHEFTASETVENGAMHIFIPSDEADAATVTISDLMITDVDVSTDITYEPYHESANEYFASKSNLSDTVGWIGGKNIAPITFDILKSINTNGTWDGNTYTLNGVTYTVNEDLSVSMSGTSIGTSSFNLLPQIPIAYLDVDNYYLTGCPEGGNASTKYALYIAQRPTGVQITETGNGLRINNTIAHQGYNIYFLIRSGIDMTGKVLKVQLEKGTSATPYYPYHKSVEEMFNDLGTASSKNSTSVVTDSSDLVESGAVKDIVGWGNKNLLGIKGETFRNTTGDIMITATGMRSEKVPCKPGDIFTAYSSIEIGGSGGITSRRYDANGKYLGNLAFIGPNDTGFVTKTVPDDAYFLGFSAYDVLDNNGVERGNFMVGRGIFNAYEPYHASVEETLRDAEVIEGKNLLNPTVASSGIVTRNADNTFTVNGTLSSTTVYELGRDCLPTLSIGNYILSGCPKSGVPAGTNMSIRKLNTPTGAKGDTGNGVVWNVTDAETASVFCYIYLPAGTYNNVIFKPMLEKGTVATAYEPYYIPLKDVVPTKADNSVIAPVENGATASQAYAVGSHAIRNGAFITWKVAKSQGETINDASDYTSGDVADCLDVLEYDFTTSQTFSNDYKNKLTKVGNIVYLSANFTGVTKSAFAPLLSIPSGLRPSKQFAFTLFISGTAKRGIVYSDGNVTSTEAISNAAINIETSWVI